ncbi:MAG: hemolysin III family protein [Oscillospiraceae bacterium]
MKRTKIKDRELPDYTKGEEIFNSSSHMVGDAFAVAALVVCVVVAAKNHNVWGIVSGAIYGSTMILLYTMSSVYHALPPTKTSKKIFQIIDHCTIFFFIAGTYTPITLCAVRLVNPTLAWTIFGVVWGLAIIGVILNAIDLKRFRIFSMISYLGMGWCIMIVTKPMLQVISLNCLLYLIFGGIAYTVGAIFYAIGKKSRYLHSTFHMFVLVGSILHFISVLYML